MYPFTTNNPGQQGANGTLTDVEENSLSSSVPTNSSFVNAAAVSTGTDAVGDANVFVTFNQNWCADFRATNISGVNGPVQTYARLGFGLIIYNGLDKDYMGLSGSFNNNFDKASTNGQVHLQRIWLLQLLQPFNPESLPCGVKVFGLSLTPKTATNPAGTSHTVTAHVTTNASPTPGVTVTFTVKLGPNVGTTGTGVTNTSGDATFTYTSNGTGGTDTIEASATLTGTGGVPMTVQDTATKIWLFVDQPITASGVTFNATEGTTFTGTVATFTDPDTKATAAEYDATIDWGDGSPIEMGVITGPTGGPFTVSGTHMYAEEGTFQVTVVITDIDNVSNHATAHSTANVGDAPLSSRCLMPSFVLQTYNGPTAGFTDQSSTGTLSDFTATINWGDSSSSPGTIVGAGGNAPYTVSGSHTYTSTGSFTVTTIINDTGGSTTTATCTVTVVPFAAETGAFVIGDLEAGIGNHVTWWGSHWANLNPMSGGEPPDAMKGFAEEGISLALPNCGGNWSTDPGNSTPPPPSVPKFMGVIVSSKVTKSESNISGDIKQVVIVENDPGYQPNPGHPGTGTEIAIVCTLP